MLLYVPASFGDLDHVDSRGLWTVPAGQACAVTQRLSAALPDEGEEELEWQAFVEASFLSLSAIAATPAAPPLRVIISVEVPDGLVAGMSSSSDDDAKDTSPAAVTIPAAIPQATVTAIHVDEPAAIADVQAALTHPEDDAAIEDVLNRDMLWYLPQEIPAIPQG
ncbi:MAG: hypothetical protein LBH13_04550 [Cellulomonadaceae bacterium]|jgi:hypothetical protein|nr:hypothetical protein [Cellulomonadaceae bacterium]